MAILTWILLGTAVGLVANRLVLRRFPGGFFGAVVGGTLGAMLGGLVASLVTGRDVAGLHLATLPVAFVGATVLLVLLVLAGAEAPRRVQGRRG